MAGRLDLDNLRPYARTCTKCHRRIPASSSNDMCSECLKKELFPAVKEYIRQNDVNEIEVSDHFGIDRQLVREWIREGRLEHKRLYVPPSFDD